MGQLRWVYSSYSEQELVKTGWDASEVPFTDNNPGTHLWSELDDRCDSVEILISGPDELSGTYEYFKGLTPDELSEKEHYNFDKYIIK